MLIVRDPITGLYKRPSMLYHFSVINVSISKLKENPSRAIYQALEYPVAIENRNEVQAYLIGKDLYESLVEYFENHIDKISVDNTDFSKGRDFEELAKSLEL